MTPFLQHVASLFYQVYGPKIARLAFVFPNRRAGLFFTKYLAEMSDQPLFSPSILTINDLFQQLGDKQPADRMHLLFTLYAIYVRKSGTTETFDDFLYWGEMLLNDFDDVDKYLADARMLFRNVTDLRAIEQDYSFLSENQLKAIRTFWSSFYPVGDSPNQKQFIEVWEILYELYLELRETLAAEGKGYEGMIFREVAEALKGGADCRMPYEKIVFVGLNALSESEERLLIELQRREIADFYWDYASPCVADPQNRTWYFAERNLRLFPSQYELPVEAAPDTQIEVVGIPSAVGQAKWVSGLLEALYQQGELNEETALRTALVLPDEHLLIPVLHSIPESVRNINVTMGYPLAGTPVASLMECVLNLQKNIRYTDRIPAFYFRDVLPVLNHPYIVRTAPGQVAVLVRAITGHNRIYVSAGELAVTPLLRELFSPVDTVDAFMAYLIRVLELLSRIIGIDETLTDEEAEATDMRLTIADIEQEFIFHYYTTVNRMREVIREAAVEMRIETCFRLVKRATDAITIPFRGEPLAGLQVMGVLETRALDFDRLIILSVNEGTFPAHHTAGSFIPYNLRRGFGLPTYEHQDSVWAYHFYRLIYRASHVSLVYDTRSGGLQTGEMSRYIHQLRYHYNVPLQEKLVVYNVSAAKSPVVEVQKTDEVMRKLAEFHGGGTRALSASTLNTYLDCPLKFYFSVIEQVQEEEEVNETVESSVFGSILHKVLEELYKPLCGQLVTADLLQLIRKDQTTLTEVIRRAFAELFFKSAKVSPLTGQNYLVGEMIRKYAVKVLERDAKLTPFVYWESERRIEGLFTLTKGTRIRLKGFIDRIDEVNGSVRLIDYKSGSGTTSFPSIESLFDKTEKNRAKAVMQVFMYGWIYGHQPGGMNKPIQPGIYYMRTLFEPGFDAGVYHHIARGQSVAVTHFAPFEADYERAMRNCLDELFDPQVPFSQTPEGKACSYCPFAAICGK